MPGRSWTASGTARTPRTAGRTATAPGRSASTTRSGEWAADRQGIRSAARSLGRERLPYRSSGRPPLADGGDLYPHCTPWRLAIAFALETAADHAASEVFAPV